jgi:molecular chaperone DnaK (HSP70)
MVEEFFEKPPYRRINQEEVVAYGATLAISNNLIIKDTISKAIGVLIQDKLSTIIPSGAVIPKAINNDFIKLKYSRDYYIQKPDIKEFKLKICEGNEENEKNVLKEYTIEVDKSSIHSIKVSIIIESDSKINVKVEVNEKEVKNDTFEIKFF